MPFLSLVIRIVCTEQHFLMCETEKKSYTLRHSSCLQEVYNATLMYNNIPLSKPKFCTVYRRLSNCISNMKNPTQFEMTVLIPTLQTF